MRRRSLPFFRDNLHGRLGWLWLPQRQRQQAAGLLLLQLNLRLQKNLAFDRHYGIVHREANLLRCQTR